MRRSLLSLAVLVTLAFGAPHAAAAPAPAPAAAPTHPFFSQPIRIVAHRGGAALAPENTVDAFRAAAQRWPEVVIETDVRLTSDGVPVLLHDPTVDRTTGGSGEIARTTLAAAQALDAGFRFTPDGGKTFPSRGRGARIPTLTEALRALPTTRLEVELKEGVEAVPAVVRAVQESGAEARVLLVSPRAEVLARVRAVAPAIATNLDEGSARALIANLRTNPTASPRPSGQLLTADPRQLAEAGVGRSEIAALARLGIPVQAFTIDDPAEMRRLLDLGVTSLVTDRPDLLAGIGGAAARADPAPSPSPADRASTPAPPRSLVVLGDSIGDPPAGSTAYAALLGASLELSSPAARVVRAARSGSRSRDLPGQVAALPSSMPGPVAVLVTIGGNDLREATPSVVIGADQNPRAALVRNVSAALDELLRPGRFGAGVEVRVYLATIYDSSDGQGGFRERGCPIPVGKLDTAPFFRRWNDDLRALAAARGVTIVDLHQRFLGHGLGTPSSWYLPDCIHPNDAGHAEIARAFGDAMGLGTAMVAKRTEDARTSRDPAGPAGAATAPPPPLGAGTHEGSFEVRLRSGSAFKVRKYTDRGDTIEVKRAGLLVTIRKSEIAAISAVD